MKEYLLGGFHTFTTYRMLREIRTERKIEGDNVYGTIETRLETL